MKNKTIIKSVVELVNGRALSGKELVSQLPFLMFLVFLTLVYIANGYLAENSIRKLNKTGNELKELRSEYITTKSDLMYKSKQSEIALALKDKDMQLEESIVPPKKIVVKLNEKQQEQL
jgi:hypothetical protein